MTPKLTLRDAQYQELVWTGRDDAKRRSQENRRRRLRVRTRRGPGGAVSNLPNDQTSD